MGWCGILLIQALGTNFGEILILVQTFSFKKMHLKIVWNILAILSRPQCVKSCRKEQNEKSRQAKKKTDLYNIYQTTISGKTSWIYGVIGQQSSCFPRTHQQALIWHQSPFYQSFQIPIWNLNLKETGFVLYVFIHILAIKSLHIFSKDHDNIFVLTCTIPPSNCFITTGIGAKWYLHGLDML